MYPVMLIIIVFLLSANASAKKLPDIFWNSSNSHLERYAALGDSIDILCPTLEPGTPIDQVEQSIIYRVPKSDYEKCRLSSKAELLARCDNPMKNRKWTVSFRQFSPIPEALTYKAGTTYYFISTSTGFADGLENDIGGLCGNFDLKMIIHVTEKNGDIASKHGLRHHHHHAHHKATPPTTTTTTTIAPTTTTTEAPEVFEDDMPAIELWQQKGRLWGQYFEKVVNDRWPLRDPASRAERLQLDEGNEKDRYPVFPEVDYQIHEIGDMETLISSSRSSSGFSALILLIFSFLLLTL